MKTTKNTVIKSCLLMGLLATTNAWTVVSAQEATATLEEISVCISWLGMGLGR